MTNLTLLDTRGLMLRAYHSVKAEGGTVKTWQEGLAQFVEHVVSPLIGGRVPPQNIIACWDSGNTYRLGLYQDYKKKRREAEKDPLVSEQVRTMQDKTIDLLAYLGVKSVHVPGEEADDLIALLCDRLEADEFVVRTGDADLTQLVGGKVSVFCGDEFYDSNAAADKNGLPFNLVALHKGLVGDSSDGYSGVPQLGKAKFSAMLQAYGTDGMLEIQEAIENDDWKPVEQAYEATKDSSLKLLLEHWSQAKLSLKLAKLNPECCYGAYRGSKPKLPKWHARIPSREKVLGILEEIKMTYIASQFEHVYPVERLITTPFSSDLTEAAQEIFESPVVSWDYESTDKLKHAPFQQAKKKGNYVDVLSQVVAGISINYGQFMEKTLYVPFDHKDTDNFTQDWLTWILSLLDSLPHRTVVQNANFEVTLSKMNVDRLIKPPFDTAIMASYVNENLLPNLKASSLHYLGYKQASYEETTQGRDMCDLTGEEVLSYGCDDSLCTSHLFVLYRTIMQLEGSWKFYCENEVEPVIDDCLDFIDGQEIDYPLLKKLAEESRETIDSSMAELKRLLAENVNNMDEQTAYTRAMTLFLEWWAVAKYKTEGDPEAEEKLRTELWTKAWNLCFYTPFEETLEVDKFVSTPTMINKVYGLLSPGLPQIKKASGPGVEQFESDLADHLGSDKAENRDDIEHLTTLLYAARKKLGPAARSGEAYEELKQFCDEILSEHGSGKTLKIGDELNTNSDPQMQGLLYGKLGLPVRKRSKVSPGSLRDQKDLKGGPGVGLKAIAAAFVYDLPEEEDWRHKVLLAYRDVALEQQNQSLYYSSYPLWKHPLDERIHPQIRNCGTATRRPASNDPNVLQVSKKDGAKLRKAYKSGNYGDGPRVVVSADFANQELVITACEAKDPVMLEAFMSTPRKDLHSLSSTGYANILLPRMGLAWDQGPMNYEDFMGLRNGSQGKDYAAAANQVRNKYSKAVNFLIAYLGGYTTLAGNLLISNDLSKQLMQSVFDLYQRLQPWQNETIAFAREHGYTQTAYGNRRHATADLWSSDDFLRKRQERQVVNATIQGCLQAGSRVLTKSGLLPIETLVGKQVEVWTGFRWANATGIVRGECRLAEITLESGLSVKCDTRHKLKNVDLKWVKFKNLAVGDLVALPEAPSGPEEFDTSNWEMGEPFLLGYWLGDGCFYSRTVTERNGADHGRDTWTICGGVKKIPELEAAFRWLDAKGFTPRWEERYKTGYSDPVSSVVIGKKGETARLAAMGYPIGTKARTKKIPAAVWSMRKEDQLQFLYGYARSDGSRNTKSPNWHSPNLPLLREIQVLLSAHGIDSSIKETSNGYKLSSRLHNTNGRYYPMKRLNDDLGGFVPNCKRGDHDSIVARRVCQNLDVCSQYQASKIYSRYLPDVQEFYRFDRIASIAVSDVVDETFTMSVNDDLHQFVADGVIHKNTAADILKEVRKELVRRKMRERYKMRATKPVYDEMTSSVPIVAVPDYCEELVESMSVTPPGYPVGMAVDLSIGNTWGSQIELSGTSRDEVIEVLERLATC